MIARFGTDVRIDKKGAIDLVTEVDVAIEREFRALHCRALSRPQRARRGDGRQSDVAPDGPCWVFDPIDGTTNFAHGLPIFCSSLALEIDGVAQVAAVYDPTRRELFTAERGGGAFLNGQPMHVSSAATLLDRVLVTGFPYDVHSRVDGDRRAVRRSSSGGPAPCGGSVRRPSTCATSRPGAWTASGSAT